MTRRPVLSPAAMAAALALAMVAVPRPSHAARDRGGAAHRSHVSFAALFDTSTRFKPMKTFKLRFRARDKVSGTPVALNDIAFSLRIDGREIALPARQLESGAFEVPFRPEGPGQYAVVVNVRGVPAGVIQPVRLGVVGVARGLVELPPEADAEVKHRARSGGKSTR